MRPESRFSRPASARNGDLAMIHIGAAALGMDTKDPDPNSAYRAMLWAVAHVRSSSELDHAGRARVLAHLRRCGFKGASPKRSRRPTPAPTVVAMCKKVRAQLIALGRLPDTYADGIAQRMYGVQFYEWLQPDQLHSLVAALQAHQRRTGAPVGNV